MTARNEDGALKDLSGEFRSQTPHRWLPNRRLSAKTVRYRLRSAGYNARRTIRRPMLTPRHKAGCLFWCQQRRDRNLRSWRKFHWSDESKFFLHMADGRILVWRQRGTAYAPRNIQETVPFGGGSVMVCGCVSYDCKIYLITVQ